MSFELAYGSSETYERLCGCLTSIMGFIIPLKYETTCSGYVRVGVLCFSDLGSEG